MNVPRPRKIICTLFTGTMDSGDLAKEKMPKTYPSHNTHRRTAHGLRSEYAKNRIAYTHTCVHIYIYIRPFFPYKYRHYTYVDTYAVSVVDVVAVLVVIVINTRQLQHICNTYTTNYADYAVKLL